MPPLSKEKNLKMFRLALKRIKKQNQLALGERVDASFIALLVGCTRQHLTRLCRNGKVPCAYQSKGGHWRSRWTRDLAYWIAANQRLSVRYPAGLRGRKFAMLEEEVSALREAAQLISRRLSATIEARNRISPNGIPEMYYTDLITNPLRGLEKLPQPSKPAAL